MVGFKSMVWLPETTHRLLSPEPKKNKSSNLGILAFEAAKTMSRLVSLYKSLSDAEISRLKNDVVKSQGVAYLNSRDGEFLLGLAFAERLEDLDRAANSVSRLGKKCDDVGLNRFDLVYTDLKLGIVDFGKLEYGSRTADRKLRKMEKLVSATSSLHAALESLTEMEVSERRLKQLNNKQIEMLQKANFDHFKHKLDNQRKDVRYFREVSLWSKTFDKSVDLMARFVFLLYARICSVFGQGIISPPIESIKEKLVPHSGPLLTTSKPTFVRFYSRKSLLFFDEDNDNDDGDYGVDEEKIVKSNKVFHSAGPTTLGGSGLALRYANVILLAEKYLDSTISVTQEERESLYQMLPENLKALVRTKLSKNMKFAQDDASLAAGWREAMEEMMDWIGPMANDTVNWQMERNFERMKFDAKPSVLLLQTLHFSDKRRPKLPLLRSWLD